jgi:hypothetical protein
MNVERKWVNPGVCTKFSLLKFQQCNARHDVRKQLYYALKLRATCAESTRENSTYSRSHSHPRLQCRLSSPPKLPCIISCAVRSSRSFRSTFPLQRLLVLDDVLHLLRAGTAGIEPQLDPFLDQLLGQLKSDDPLSEAEYLSIIAKD